jgi:Flp pilus assembly protein TadG
MQVLKRDQSGQALLEMALVVPMMLVFLLGIVDFSRAAYDREVTTNLAGEGSSIASRGLSGGVGLQANLAATAALVITDAGSDVNMATYGCVIRRPRAHVMEVPAAPARSVAILCLLAAEI